MTDASASPARDAGDRLRRKRAPAGPASHDAPALRARILIVDDDERNAFAATHALEDLGHELVVARSGEEALKALLDKDFAVILLDLHMPGMDGYETAELIRQRRKTRRVPIVFLTAVFRDEAHLFQAYSAGAVDVVFKPVDPFILRSKVSVLVDLHLKTEEIQLQAERQRRLHEEHRRVLLEKHAAELALQRSQERQDAILKSLPVVFTSRAAVEPYPALFVSDAVRKVTGFDPDHFVSEPEFGFTRIHPEDQARVRQAFSQAIEHGSYACEYRWLCADGQYRVLMDQGVVGPGDAGQEIFGTILDGTDRRSLEEQLAQARKMEAVGQLTGGVAHDFNNLLTVVLGNVDLLLRKPDKDPKRQRQLEAMRHAAERGRALTRQLLAFSRRQHLSPVTLDAGGLVRDFAPLMRQAVGDAVVITLDLPQEALAVHADPAHLETALLNLAVNARDAMPAGGALTISVEATDAPEALLRRHPEAAVNRWIRIEVRDTGTGIPAEVMERVFEPFFTTKEIGKGSGLGLSQVYGFVRQSGGHVLIDSREGEGAAVTLFLPLSTHAIEILPLKPTAKAVGGSERVLVVEDDPSVLSLTVEVLTELGYEVLTATDAASALKVLQAGARIELLFSDVVMPGGISGVQLARAARELNPQIRVLLTSGYTASRLEDNEFELLDKPYDRTVLATKLREVMQGGRRQAGKEAAAPERAVAE